MSFKPMLAKDADPSTLTYPLMLQPKLDGIRASVVGGRLVSRTLKDIPNEEIREALARPELEGLDGEIIVGNPSDPECYRSTCSFVMSESKTGADWSYYVFDLWNRPETFRRRFAALEDFFAWEVPPRIKIVGTTVVTDALMVESVEADLLSKGLEGVILRDPDAPYKFGRSGKKGPLIKVKRFIDFEAEVIGVYEEMHNGNEAKRNELGRTERSTAKAGLVGKGTLGGLVLRAINGPSEGIEFRCGTGFDAGQRSDLWQEWHDFSANYAGRVAKIKSFPIGVKDKPRHPVFLGWRDMEVDG